MARLNIPISKNKKLNFYALVGPYIGFLFNANQHTQTDDLKVYLDIDGNKQIPHDVTSSFFGTKVDTIVDAMDDLHHTNIGVQGGIGFSYKLGPGKIFIQGGGNYGFMDIQKGDEHGKNHIGAGTVTFGYVIHIRRKKEKS